MIQLVSQVLPPSAENACSHRGDPVRVHRYLHRIFLPLRVSSPTNSPGSPWTFPNTGGCTTPGLIALREQRLVRPEQDVEPGRPGFAAVHRNHAGLADTLLALRLPCAANLSSWPATQLPLRTIASSFVAPPSIVSDSPRFVTQL